MAPPEPPSGPSQQPIKLSQILSHQGLVAVACICILAGTAWWWLWQAGSLAAGAMPGMQMPTMQMIGAAQAWSGRYLAASFVMWAVMMVAMMLPSAAPMILLHEVFSRRNRLGLAATFAFATSYLMLWTGFALIATIVQSALIGAGALGAASLAIGDARLTALLLLGAAAFELSPLKRVCLAQCQSPLVFVSRRWRPGIAGAIDMGLKHGAYCLGCCAGLMLLLLVGGVMNLAWIAFLTAIVLAEKYAPPTWRADRVIAALLALGAIALAAARL